MTETRRSGRKRKLDDDETPTQEEEKSNKKSASTNESSVQSANVAPQRVIIFRGDESNESGNDLELIQLTHPKTGKEELFAISGNRLLELQKSTEGECSWFIGDTVEQDGGIFMAMPLDPLFVVIAMLFSRPQAERKYFKPKEQLIESTESLDHVAVERMMGLDGLDLSLVCDSQEACGTTVYRLNPEKVVLWLRFKVKVLIDAEDMPVGMATSMISEYISADLAKQLRDAEGVKEETPKKKSTATAAEDSAGGKGRKADEPPEKKKKLTPGQARVAKVAEALKRGGQRTIGAFFTKK